MNKQIKPIIQECPVCGARGRRFEPYPLDLVLKNLPCFNCDRIRKEELDSLKHLKEFKQHLMIASQEIKEKMLLIYTIEQALPTLIDSLSNPATASSATTTTKGTS